MKIQENHTVNITMSGIELEQLYEDLGYLIRCLADEINNEHLLRVKNFYILLDEI